MPTIPGPAGPIYYSPSTSATPTSSGVTNYPGGAGAPGASASAASSPAAGTTPITNPSTGEVTNVNLGTPAAQSAFQETLALQGQYISDTTNATAQELIARGDATEAGAYNTAAGISGSNASLALQAAQLEAYQEALVAKQTLGTQRANVAASGFQEAGSSLSILRASVRQSALTQGLTLLQGNITAGGFYAQQAAAQAEALGATTASNAAAALASGENAAGTLALANSTNLTHQLANPTSPGVNIAFASGGVANSSDPFGQFSRNTAALSYNPQQSPIAPNPGAALSLNTSPGTAENVVTTGGGSGSGSSDEPLGFGSC